jgi:hypothetical protein
LRRADFEEFLDDDILCLGLHTQFTDLVPIKLKPPSGGSFFALFDKTKNKIGK